MRFLAVDPGGKRIGLASGDDVTGVVTPGAVLAHHGLDASADAIAERARELGAEIVVVGLPTDADGAETPACRRSHALAAALRERGLEVALQPEYLTSDEARRRARAAGRRRDAPIDDLAAGVILEEHLATR